MPRLNSHADVQFPLARMLPNIDNALDYQFAILSAIEKTSFVPKYTNRWCGRISMPKACKTALKRAATFNRVLQHGPRRVFDLRATGQSTGQSRDADAIDSR